MIVDYDRYTTFVGSLLSTNLIHGGALNMRLTQQYIFGASGEQVGHSPFPLQMAGSLNHDCGNTKIFAKVKGGHRLEFVAGYENGVI